MDTAKKKMIASGIAAAVAVGILGYIVLSSVLGSAGSPANQSRRRTVIDAVSGEVFEDFAVPDNVSFPLKHPKTSSNTLFPAEACYWDKGGKAKLKPTWVLLNTHAGKPEPTLCPDCGRPVVPHNPMPPVSAFEGAK